jgi:hypothetical protein
MIYALICLSLSLVGTAGLQFFYLTYLERMNREHKKRIHELERRTRFLSERLDQAERQIAENAEQHDEDVTESEDEEIWADVIDDR